MKLGENEVLSDIQVVSTGSLGLDIALGVGGLPRSWWKFMALSHRESPRSLQVVAEEMQRLGTCAFIDAETRWTATTKVGLIYGILFLSRIPASKRLKLLTRWCARAVWI